MANCKTYTNKINSIQIYFFKGVLGIKGKKKKKNRRPKRENVRLA